METTSFTRLERYSNTGSGVARACVGKTQMLSVVWSKVAKLKLSMHCIVKLLSLSPFKNNIESYAYM